MSLQKPSPDEHPTPQPQTTPSLDGRNSVLTALGSLAKKPLTQLGLFMLAIKPLANAVYWLVDLYGNIGTFKSIFDFLNTTWGTVVLMSFGFGLIAWQIHRQNRLAQPKEQNELTGVTEPYGDHHLHSIADYQRKTLRRYVLVENCEVNSSPLSEGKRYIEFTFTIINYSMYYVTIPMHEGEEVKGSIKFKGEMLSGAAKLFENKAENCEPYGRKYFKIRQWVSPHEATDILEALEKSGNLFDFSEANIFVSGGDKHPNVEEDKLDLTRGMQNAALENKIIQLETDLREEKAAQERLEDQHSKKMSTERHRVGAIRAINYARGAALIVQRQLEEGEGVSKDMLLFLTTIISPVVEQNFSDPQVSAFFKERLKNIPSEPFAQRYWIDELFEALSRLLDQKGG